MSLRKIGFFGVAFVCAAMLRGEAQPTPGVLIPVEAELLAHTNVRNLKVGSLIYARVAIDWSGPGCNLKRGATLEVKVVDVSSHSPGSNQSKLALSFQRAQCGTSDMEPFALMLAAVAAPDDADSGAVSTDLPMVFGSNTGPSAPSAGMMRSSLAEVDPLLVNVHRFPKTSSLRAGDVLGIKGLKLKVGEGPENSSVLSCSCRDLELFRHTRLLLLPSSVTTAKAQATAQPQTTAHTEMTVGLVTRPAPPSETPEEEIEACVPPACSIADTSDAPQPELHASAAIPIGFLGYAPRLQTEMEAPDQDETLAYLSPNELLVTFNPHLLVPRMGATMPGATVRVIRAALIDVLNKKVLRSVDWHLPDSNQYLWTLAGQRVLVHVGNELRVYGSGLKVEARLALTGPLAFVRTSPDGNVIAIAMINERHSPELHTKLRSNLDREPEEDVDILILNERFETLAHAASTSDRLPPTLLNEGQVKLLLQSMREGQTQKRYRLELRTWNNSSVNLGKFTSECVPQISSLVPDLLLLVTCDKTNHAREYQLERQDGKPVLRGLSMLKEIGHAASGDAQSKEFAVRIFQAAEPILPGEVFRGDNLQSAQIAVYRSDDGKQLYTVRVSDPAASSGGYALAPGGTQLAVLLRDRIALYAVPAN
jgi:hypothetical protein